MSNLLTEEQVIEITDLKKPTYQAKKLAELGYVVLGFSARGRVRALAEHPAEARVKGSTEPAVRLNLP
ncbi:MAG: hypothetical protein AAFY29_11440 [Pseudomonadota bacterium]